MALLKSNEESETLSSYSLMSMDMSRLTPMTKMLLDVALETFRPYTISQNFMLRYQFCHDRKVPPRS